MSQNIIAPEMHDGELRILDTDLAARLGFSQPRDIRKLIKRYLPELDRMGVRATVAQTSSERGGRPTEAYYLNRKQAIFITAKSETAEATDITIEIIERFDAYERGEVRPAIANETPEMLAFRAITALQGKLEVMEEQTKLQATLEAQLTRSKLLEAKMDALIAKADQALVLMDRPAPAPSTIVAPYQGPVHASHGDEGKVLAALKDLGGKASIRELSRRLCWLASRRDAALESLCEEGIVAFDRGKGSTPRGGRPDKGSVRLLQIPFAKTPARAA